MAALLGESLRKDRSTHGREGFCAKDKIWYANGSHLRKRRDAKTGLRHTTAARTPNRTKIQIVVAAHITVDVQRVDADDAQLPGPSALLDVETNTLVLREGKLFQVTTLDKLQLCGTD